jgi:hypothetical protein
VSIVHDYIITTSLFHKCKANLVYKGLLELGLLPKMNHLTLHLSKNGRYYY